MSYALFNLRALVYAAHLAEANGLSAPGPKPVYEVESGALLAAMAFYGRFYDFQPPSGGQPSRPGPPVSAPDAKSPLYPYDGESPSGDDFGQYIVAAFDLAGSADPRARDPGKSPAAIVRRNLGLKEAIGVAAARRPEIA
jgi:hypothetical protein